ncbi:hypothetical protein BDN72DRAFT_841783 [Pluteus cervinus]|uniref:Uncharacterized protein n=1 Tax=Pluteus cervinus TaxID=181527 RepID=A0ACD3ARQ3_9AGAR|nr:hypothetical protein BDN72DRAFT_841783 [Pluteus cervinus]
MQTFKADLTEGLGTGEPGDETREIDEEIQKLQAQIRALRTRRNRLTLISKLPAEIMTLIFSIARDLHLTDLSPSMGKAILIITWVCQDWRELAFAIPELWNVIDLKAIEFVQSSLERSKNLPLSVELLGITPDTPSLPFILQSIPRTKSLQLTSLVDQPNLSLAAGWQQPAPLLEKLTLDSFSFSNMSFAGTIPPLRKLSLSECRFNWKDLPLPTHLQSLRIVGSEPRLSSRDILSLLQLIPNLKVLGLYQTLEELGRVGPRLDTLPFVNHTHLSRLLVEDETADAALTLFQRLKTPSNTYISVRCAYDQFTRPHRRFQLLRVIGQCRSPAEEVLPISLKIMIRIQLETSAIEVTTKGDQADGRGFRVEFPDLNNPSDVESTIAVCDLLNLQDLETMVIDCHVDAPRTLSSLIFGHSPVLRILKIRGRASSGFIQRFTQETQKDISAFPLRELEYLELEKIQRPTPDLYLLRLALTAWKNRLGHRLQKLVIVMEGLMEGMESFEGVVEHVEYRETA